jgi:hypothetical protein
MYKENIKADAAIPTGQIKTKFIHKQIKAGTSPNALLIYMYSPPDSGMEVPHFLALFIHFIVL